MTTTDILILLFAGISAIVLIILGATRIRKDNIAFKRKYSREPGGENKTADKGDSAKR